ncbi:hypothetical protein B0H19DRAFT_1155915 [Mycena capillaripes]|nr:hypothetical protein B0H19DRAFT_1155915 [Mycena capillaripes]
MVRLLAILGAIILLPPLFLVFVGLQLLAAWPITCLFMCWVYIIAFFPQSGYFPPTGMSALDMDQAAALLTIVVVAVIRSWRPIFKARPTAASHELSPLLPVSSDRTTDD